MRLVAVISGFLLILIILWDAFETVILQRRVTRRIRLTGVSMHRYGPPLPFLRGFLEAMRLTTGKPAPGEEFNSLAERLCLSASRS